jgi:hypothetical protein
MVTHNWFEEFFSDTLQDDTAIRRFLATVPDDQWPRFHRDAVAHITAVLHQRGLEPGTPGDMEYGSVHIVTPLLARAREPVRRRLHLLAEEDKRRQRRQRRRQRR